MQQFELLQQEIKSLQSEADISGESKF